MMAAVCSSSTSAGLGLAGRMAPAAPPSIRWQHRSNLKVRSASCGSNRLNWYLPPQPRLRHPSVVSTGRRALSSTPSGCLRVTASSESASSFSSDASSSPSSFSPSGALSINSEDKVITTNTGSNGSSSVLSISAEVPSASTSAQASTSIPVGGTQTAPRKPGLAELLEKRKERLAALQEAEKELREAYREAANSFSDDICGYGFRNPTVGIYSADSLPKKAPPSVVILALANFAREFQALFRYIVNRPTRTSDGVEKKGALYGLFGTSELDEKTEKLREQLSRLTLSASAIRTAERRRPEVESPLLIRLPYDILCAILDRVYSKHHPIQRFWLLETVARMPYFSYISMLHLYESLGWWRLGTRTRLVHFAEEWNEFHHLLIMESLGGDREWKDRFIAGHAAILYYWIMIVLWLYSPRLAYNFSELIESHAVDTYGTFVTENAELLKQMPAPLIARRYYLNEDLYLFDEFQTSRAPSSRRPPCSTLYDVFSNIRDDEAEHVATMIACQDYARAQEALPWWEATGEDIKD